MDMMMKPQAKAGSKTSKQKPKTGKKNPKTGQATPKTSKKNPKTGQATPKTSKVTSKATKGGTKGAGAKAGTLAVTGEGEIRVRPDIAILGVNVVTSAKTAQEAVQRNAEKMSAVVEALRDMGIRPAELQTVGYDVIPILDQDEKSPTWGRILEYRVVSQLRVRVDVEQAGEVIDTAVAAGANMASGVRYSVRDETAVRSRALESAVRAARRDADVVARAVGVKIRDSETVEINMGGMPVFFREMALPKAGSISTPIEPGTIEIRASVRIVYRTT